MQHSCAALYIPLANESIEGFFLHGAPSWLLWTLFHKVSVFFYFSLFPHKLLTRFTFFFS